jgi:hypothetical protein
MRLLRDDADGDRFVGQDPQVLRLLARRHVLLDGPPLVQVLRETDVPRGGPDGAGQPFLA